MERGTTFIGWLAGGTGIVLLYAAYRNMSPVDIVRSTLIGTPATTKTVTVSDGLDDFLVKAGAPIIGVAGGEVFTNPSDRAKRIADEIIQPTLVPIPSQPYLLLDIEAMQSFMKVQIAYGRPVILSGAYSTQAAHDKAASTNPNVLPGTKSLHLDGLAVDVNQALMNVNDPKLVSAFQTNGWFRRGKVLADGKPEAWHWSYGVPG